MQTAAPDSYAPRAPLEAGVLDAIHQANAAFLKLAARRTAGAAADSLGLPAPIGERIAALDDRARRLASQCAYSLFNLRFEDAGFWTRLAAECVEERASERDLLAAERTDAAAARAALDDTTFALKAVVLTWHVARQGDLATLLLGMAPPVQSAWQGIALSALDRVALAVLPVMQLRWGASRFWPQLLDAVQPPDPEALERARLLGLQLLATDGFRAQPPRRLAARFAGVAIATSAVRARRS
jgi:hypothetical protein